ncbi:hypothetical protein [Kribbella catacumbae]|nr:hypothetical protein [Kribbella catacumbae]
MPAPATMLPPATLRSCPLWTLTIRDVADGGLGVPAGVKVID